MSTLHRAFIREKINVAQNDPPIQKKYMGFCISKIWQILKHLSATFHYAKLLIFEEY